MSDLKIKVGGKDYDIPDLDFDHWQKIIDKVEKRNEGEIETAGMLSPQGIKDAVEFFFDLLNPYHPEVTKRVLGKMPVYQGGMEFTAKIIAELMHVPLDSPPSVELTAVEDSDSPTS